MSVLRFEISFGILKKLLFHWCSFYCLIFTCFFIYRVSIIREFLFKLLRKYACFIQELTANECANYGNGIFCVLSIPIFVSESHQRFFENSTHYF